MRRVARDFFHAAAGQLELIGNGSELVSWANASISPSSHPAHGKLCRPTRQPRAAARCVPDGPIRANCLSTTMHEMSPGGCLHTIIFTLLWASSSSSARTVHLHHRPMRAFLPAAILPPVFRMGQCKLIVLSTTVHEMGPCEWLRVIASMLLGANSSSSARQCIGITGQCEHFSQQPSLSLKVMPARQSRAAAHCVPDGPM
jgi:hypothetical protein